MQFSFLLLAFLMLTACSTEQNTVWLEAWREGPSMTTPRAAAAAVHHNDFVYLLGGVDGVTFLSSVERAKINKDGSLGAWQRISPMPQARGFFDAITVNNFVFVVGGGNGANGKNLLRTVIRAEILEDGELGHWQSQPSLKLPRRCVKLALHDNKLYALGGFGGALLDTVEVAEIDALGNLGEWSILEQTMTTPRYVNAVKKFQGRLYVFGGHHSSKGTGLNSTESAELKPEETQWKEAEPMRHGRYALSAANVNEHLFVMGGISGLEYLSSVERLTSAGWNEETSLPEAMANFSTISTNQTLYVFGGVTRDAYISKVRYASVNKKGNIGITASDQQAITYKESLQTEKAPKDRQKLPNTATVINVIPTDQYTYVHVNDNGEEYWIAGPVTMLQIGDTIHFSQGVFMSNFYSKSINRRFSKILFVSQLQIQQKI